jgi:hypothetical protein
MRYKYAFVLIALATTFATSASAQYDPTAPGGARQQRSRVHVYAPDLARSPPGYERNSNANPDFQLGGQRWKTNAKSKHARHRRTASRT